ncbi:glutathione S-transferase family protein [Sphingomonas sp. KC8]|uniref:glutathione S-transferase family protein n=1 Tax=Sphingomonas sp. KC8 TaxID=1030157 RepID=UPI0002D2EE71|nr:glutathione S-transferase N-terminal domain-containing protein [Sphingomonas sp. KC8]
MPLFSSPPAVPPAIELYGMASPNVRKITIMLEELGLAYAFRHVAVFRAGQFEADFLALNPNGKVPVLVDHTTPGQPPVVRFESAAILIYLAERHGQLLAPAEPDRGAVLQWLMIQACNVGPMLGQLNHFQFAARDGNDYAYDRYRNEAERLYRLIDQRLAAHAHLAGDTYSIADIATFPWMAYLEKHGFGAGDFPHLCAWRDRIGARAAVQRGLAAIHEAEAIDAEALRTASASDMDRFFGRR